MSGQRGEGRRDDRPIADIALLLEGTYPYVRGGVSSWVHQIVTGLPEYTFAIVFLGGLPEHYEGIQYELPENVVHLETHYIMHASIHGEPDARSGKQAQFEAMRAMHGDFRARRPVQPEVMAETLGKLGTDAGITREDFLYGEEAWAMITDHYERFCTDPSFIDYFWTVRIMHAPLFLLAEIARDLPPVRALHAVSTGYAGLLGAMLAARRGLPFVLTEHGIYTKERKIDLVQAQWIRDQMDALGADIEHEAGYIRQLWIRFFEVLGRLAYQQADPIISLHRPNQLRQIKDGAPPEKCRIIPNGIDIERFRPVLEARPEGVPPVVGLVGRVVPIKDIKTFIRAMRAVCDTMPEAEGWIVGPEEEDPLYVAECRALVRSLDLEDRVKFLGFRRVDEIFPQLGLIVLTSISESQPLVILEGYAAGLPCVATDVGSCRELVEGRDEEDRALGAGGRIVPIADPEATAQGILSLLEDEAAWQAAQRAGLERVRRYYRLDQMYDAYRGVYDEALERSPWQA
ncbi:GT4 family glycosyltransferase PelF [Sulfurivirga sp.]|uniref:GT4 family glycosyltransferase PelF n=1 Tax=Sulfurivirga sp. TaxID=2614236 RepID=UPI0025F6BB75|nr:GT4 family glycosyltransferase PelF [Sulfurivirga sp.]